jgi:hypothetical protein
MYHDLARELRKNMTDAERRLWSHLRGKQFGGFRFRRQAPIGEFIVDDSLALKTPLGEEVLHWEPPHPSPPPQGGRELAERPPQRGRELAGPPPQAGSELAGAPPQGGRNSEGRRADHRTRVTTGFPEEMPCPKAACLQGRSESVETPRTNTEEPTLSNRSALVLARVAWFSSPLWKRVKVVC